MAHIEKPWRKELAERIAEIQQTGQKGVVLIDLRVPRINRKFSWLCHYRVNFLPFCGAPARTLFYLDHSFSAGSGFIMHFAYRTEPWTPTETAEIVGSSAFPPIDFDLLDPICDE